MAGAQRVDLFVDAICKYLFIEVEMAYGHFSSELMFNSTKCEGDTWRQDWDFSKETILNVCSS